MTREKSEIRISKSETSTNVEIPKESTRVGIENFEHSSFEFGYCFEFRVSSFEFARHSSLVTGHRL
jgi:hypothetical protein